MESNSILFDSNFSDIVLKLNTLHNSLENAQINKSDLHNAFRKRSSLKTTVYRDYINLKTWIWIGVFVGIISNIIIIVNNSLGIRCLVPNNYLIWEATRPISNCDYCRNVKQPLFFPNLSREEFAEYAYSSKPIIIKNSISHWPAKSLLDFEFIHKLYNRTPGSLEYFNDECQFLHFKSDFSSLNDVLKMSSERTKNGKYPWYVGFSNCNPKILHELRKLYPKPHFLPRDSEMPNTDYIFLGYEQGATMHLDYIPRLMWQAQLQGRKKWMLAPVPECDNQCDSFSFTVEPGDAILIDTRIWYHSTFVSNRDFSLTIQSEYG